MGKTSKSRSNVQIRGVAESRLRTEQKRINHGDHDPQNLLTTESIRSFLDAMMCPWCDRGPFKIVSIHTSRMHGVGPKELRDLAGLYYSASLTDPETNAKLSAAGKKRDMDYVRAARVPGDQTRSSYSEAARANIPELRRRKRDLSEAAKERNRLQLEAVRDKGQAAAAAAMREAAEVRFETADPVIREAVNNRTPYSEVAIQLGVSTAQVGRWAKRMGLPDGRTLAAQWREYPVELMREGSERALANARDRDSADWESSDRSWQKIAEMADARGVSEKAMRGRLRSLGFDIGDGRVRGDRKRRTNYPAKRTACDVDGCAREHVGRGLCRYHYQKWRVANGKVPECERAGCVVPVVARKLCGKHYAAARSR